MPPSDQSFALDFYPGSSIVLALFRNVVNSKDLRKQLLAGEIKPEFAFIDASTVVDPFPVLLAANKAFAAHKANQLQTKNVYSELIFNLSGSKHVAEALRRFGIKDDTANLLVARYDATAEDLEVLTQLVQGDKADLSELAATGQQELIMKYYHITPQELKVGTLADAAAARIAAKECN